MPHIERPALLRLVRQRLRQNPAVLLLGPRQCGKTTLAREVARGKRVEFFDLERPDDRQRLSAPLITLEPLRGLVIIDEAQLQPDLFPVLRVLLDRAPPPARFLLLGSASPDLAVHVSESLAGRVARVDMAGFDLDEVGAAHLRRLWWRGGLPRSYLAPSDRASDQWRSDFIDTFLERDLRRFGVQIPPLSLRRFWNMIAHHHAQLWNASEIGRSLGEAHTTVRRHLDILTGALVIRQLPPWFENIGKRQVKSPKVYLRDSGLLHALLGLPDFASLQGHPKLGASWEGFALEEALRVTGDREAYFWSTQAGAELDLLIFHRGRRYGIDFKYSDAPRLTKSLHVARKDLGLVRVALVYPGTKRYRLERWAEAVPLTELREWLAGRPQPRRAIPGDSS